MAKISKKTQEMLESENTNAMCSQESSPFRAPNINSVDRFKYPLDKPNSILWNNLPVYKKALTTDLNIDVSKRKNKEINISVFVNFEGISNEAKISRSLTQFDKHIYIIISNLLEAGNNFISLSQVYAYLNGKDKKPSFEQLRRIHRSIEKMSFTKITFDNKQEADKYRNVPYIRYEGSLLPAEILTIKRDDPFQKDNQMVIEIIHILVEKLPLMDYAIRRRQITTISIELLQCPLSKTDSNLQIGDYLIRQISHAKHKRTNKSRLLLNTIFENTSSITRIQKSRSRKKICIWMNHFKKCGFISNYCIDEECLNISW